MVSFFRLIVPVPRVTPQGDEQRPERDIIVSVRLTVRQGLCD